MSEGETNLSESMTKRRQIPSRQYRLFNSMRLLPIICYREFKRY